MPQIFNIVGITAALRLDRRYDDAGYDKSRNKRKDAVGKSCTSIQSPEETEEIWYSDITLNAQRQYIIEEAKTSKPGAMSLCIYFNNSMTSRIKSIIQEIVICGKNMVLPWSNLRNSLTTDWKQMNINFQVLVLALGSKMVFPKEENPACTMVPLVGRYTIFNKFVVLYSFDLV